MSTATKEPPAVAIRPQLEAVSTAAHDEVSFKELASILWRSKVSIGIATVLFSGLGVIAGLVIPKKYEGAVILSPVTEDASGSSGRFGAMSSLMAQFGVGGLLGASGGTKRAESLALLQSEWLTDRYIQENHLLPVLFASKWDAKAGTWNVTDPEKIPQLWDGNRAFKKIRLVADDPKTGLVKLTVTWKDPKVAARWANDLVKMTNEESRARAISEAQRNIAYLEEQAAKTTAAELRQAIYQLLQTEMKKEMLARGDDEYALKVIDPATEPRKPTTPGLMVWGGAGLAGGLVLSVIFTLFGAAWNGTASQRRDPAGSVPLRR
jgi:capsular polysaccharide biosynthesis protein